MKKTFRRRAWFWLAMFALAGCSGLSTTESASVNLTHLRPLQASLFETSAEMTVRYANETTEPLTLAGSVHRLYLNGSYVGRAVSNEAVEVAGLSTVTRKVVLHLENLALLRKAQQLRGAKAVDYRLDSILHPAAGSGRPRLRLSSRGEVDLSGFSGETVTKVLGER